jgi:hypothetical protein
VYDKYAIYADTINTLKLTDAERRLLNRSELEKMASEGKMAKDDVNLYTTKH